MENKEVVLFFRVHDKYESNIEYELPSNKEEFVACVSQLIEMASQEYGIEEEELARVLGEMIPLKRQIYKQMKNGDE